jgi:hypothetical protein
MGTNQNTPPGTPSTESADLLALSFTHPHSEATFDAEVRASGTVEECLKALVAENFLEPEKPGRQYLVTLERTNTALPRGMALSAAGARPGDVLGVSVAGTAAGHV